MPGVLITGGAGFVGSHLADALVRSGHRVVLYDNFATGRPANVGDLACVTGDILDLGHLLRTMRRHDVDRVVHGAAIVGVPASLERPVLATKVNIEGSLTVFEACQLAGVRRIVDLSSEEVYGEFREAAVDETARQEPVSPYGISKHSVELLSKHFDGLPYVAARLCWVYGPRFPRARLPQVWLCDALAGRRSTLATGGDQRVDFTYIDDAVDGLLRLLDAERLAHRAYHLATGTAHTIRDLADMLKRLVPGWTVDLGGGTLPLNVQKGALVIDRARDELGYEPRVDLATGLAWTAATLA